MFTIHIRLQCSDRSEVLGENRQEAEATIEDVISCSMLQLFDSVNVDEICMTSTEDEHEHHPEPPYEW
ncbi:MAG TPA: hypothetical protein VFQ30_07360 [Ktedonobacteraceae bacterium]|nr:hypothetical protein [Ktedonobacteraceae bacterium]